MNLEQAGHESTMRIAKKQAFLAVSIESCGRFEVVGFGEKDTSRPHTHTHTMTI